MQDVTIAVTPTQSADPERRPRPTAPAVLSDRHDDLQSAQDHRRDPDHEQGRP
ncbi:hypothetical protein V3481_007395 [Fusarium oxysporum f. sp. vasinfectum]